MRLPGVYEHNLVVYERLARDSGAARRWECRRAVVWGIFCAVVRRDEGRTEERGGLVGSWLAMHKRQHRPQEAARIAVCSVSLADTRGVEKAGRTQSTEQQWISYQPAHMGCFSSCHDRREAGVGCWGRVWAI
jgi:hypothetical protein